MKRICTFLTAGVSCLLFAAAATPRQAEQAVAPGAQPRFLNATVEQRSAGGDVATAFRASVREARSPSWIGYSVAALGGDHGLCDADRPQRIYLEGRPRRTAVQDQTASSGDLVILFRVETGTVQRLRVASIKCEIDAGGLPVAWLSGASGAGSVALLRSLIGQKDGVVNEQTVVMALALHADPAAGRALQELAAPGQATPVRKRAVFWLGVGRGDVDTLVRLARADESLDIRKEAMFWLSRSQDPRAIAFTEEILRK